MNRHETITINAGTKLVGLTLAAAMTVALGCSDSGGAGTGKGGTSGTAGTTGSAGSTAGSGGSSGGTGGSAAGTGGSAAGTGGSAAGTGGSVGGSTAGTGGSAAGTGGAVGGSAAGTGGATTGGSGGSSTGGTGGSGGVPWLTLPANLPPTLNAPAGATLKLRTHATGDQVYTCTASAAGGTGGGGATTYSWVLKQPDAKLYDQSNTQVGTHGIGPNWTSTADGSVVNGARAYQENAPLADAIPWLLLRATSNTGTGAFSDVTYVLRANTTGGKAPASGCDATTANAETRVAYTADYFFFNGGGPGTAWMTTPANLPAAIAVPSGAALKLHDHAIGVQVYTCTPSAAGGAGGGAGGAGGAGGGGATTYSWVLKQPDAVLYDPAFVQVGTHGAGPSWTGTDGSVVNAARIAQASSTMSGAIAWLLLQTSSTTGTGRFSDITYVQRLNTAGGPAPASGCDATTSGTEVRIPYSADYYFFTGGTTTTDGGTNG